MMLFRRFLVMLTFMLWLGGFLFYSGLVVPTGRSILRPPSSQAFVTREVTGTLTWIGIAGLLTLIWELATCQDWRKTRLAVWLILAITLGIMTWLHAPLSSYMDTKTQTILDREAIKPYHWGYMIAGSLQMIAGLLYVGLTISAWHRHDSKGGI